MNITAFIYAVLVTFMLSFGEYELAAGLATYAVLAALYQMEHK